MKKLKKLQRQVTASPCHDTRPSLRGTTSQGRLLSLSLAQRLFLFLTILVMGVNGAWATSYIPTFTKEITADVTYYYSDFQTAETENWAKYAFGNITTSPKRPTDINGNSINTDQSCLQVKADGNVFNDNKRVLHFRVKGITGVIASGSVTSGRGFQIGATDYTNETDENTTMNIVAGNSSAENPVSCSGLDPEKTYIISILAYSGDTYLYAVKFLTRPSVFTVNFNAGTNGTCATTSLTEASQGAGVTLPTVTVRDGYRFMGWSESSTPTSADAGSAGAAYNPTSDCTLYAYYTTLNPATVSATGGGTYNVGASITLTGSATATNEGNIYGISGINNGNAYRWKSCNSDGSNLRDISSATKTTYTVPSTTPGKYYFRFMCVESVAGTAGYKTTLSDIVEVIVKGTPTITADCGTTADVEIGGSKNITLTSQSTGAYSVTTSNDKLSATISGNILTLQSNGSSVSGVSITVSQAASDIYNAPTNLIITAQTVKKNMAAPTISCTNNSVTITSPVGGATIYYTTDGTTPTNSSTVYTGAFSIAENKTIKAFATANDYNDSEVNTYNAQFVDDGNKISQLVAISTSETYIPSETLSGGTEGALFNSNKIFTMGDVSYSANNGVRVKNGTCYLAFKVSNGANVQIIGKRHGGKTEPDARILYVGTTAGGKDLGEITIPYNEIKSVNLYNISGEQIIYVSANDKDLDVQKIIVTYVDAPTFSEPSTIDIGQTITLTGPAGSTIYGVWNVTYQEAGTVKANKHETGASPLVVTPNQPGTWTLQAVAEKDGVLSLISTHTYTIRPRYTVTFDSNGGTPVASVQQASNGASVALPNSARKEYNFDGWYTAKTGGSKIENPNNYTPTSDITLYAHWIRHTVYEGTTIGSPNKEKNTWWSAFSQFITLKQGIKYHVSFKNYGGDSQWLNWQLVASNVEAHGKQDNSDYEEYFVLRSDNYGEGGKYKIPKTCTYNELGGGWSEYATAMKKGANVEMDITYTASGTIEVEAKTTVDSYNWTYEFESKTGIPANPVVFFALDQCYLTDFTVTVPSYTYTVNAVSSLTNPEDHVIDIIETGETTEGVNVYYPLAFELNGNVYKTDRTKFKKTFGPATSNEDQKEDVLYAIDNTLVAFVEGEDVKNGTNEDYSNGGYGHVNGSKMKFVKTLQPGSYTVSAYLVSDPNRQIILRKSDKTEIATTGIVTGSALKQLYTSAVFNITEPTDVYISGYTNDKGAINQSAKIDYAYIKCADGLAIRKDPVDATYYQNAAALQLTVDVYAYKGGFVTPNYQWYRNATNSNEGGTLISGETNATYQPSTASAGTTYYYCVVSYSGLTTQKSQPAKIDVVDGITCNKAGHHVHKDGSVPTGAFWTNFSDSYEINTAKEKTFSFNVAGGDASYNNWFIALSSAPGHHDDTKYEMSFEKLILRGDGYGWNDGYNAKGTQLLRVNGGNKEIMTVPATNGGFSDATFIDDMKDADVEVKVTYSVTVAYIYAKITSNTGSGNVYYLSQTTNDIPAGTLYVFFGTDGSTISNFTTTDQVDAYSVSATMTTADAGLLQIFNSDGIATPSGTYVGAGTRLRVVADIYSGYKLTGWSATGTTGTTPNNFEYDIASINANTVVTATTGESSYSFVPKAGQTNPSYIITKGAQTSFPEDLLSINGLTSETVKWSYEVVKDGAASYKGINYAASTLSASIDGTDGIGATKVTINSSADSDGGAVVVTALIKGTDKLSYVITMPYIGNHAFDMHHMANKAEVKADGHWSLGYEVIEGVKHKDPLVQLSDRLYGNNAGIVNETNGLYITTEGGKNLGMSVLSGVTTNETNAYDISDVTGVNLLALKNATVTIPQVKEDWFIKLYLDPHAGGVHRSGAGSEFTITNVKDLEGNAIDENDVLCTNGVQWDRSGIVDLKTPDKDFRGCMIFRVAGNGDVKINFKNNGWDKLVRIVVTNSFSSEMALGSVGSRTVDYLRWNHTFTHRVYDNGLGDETGDGVKISYNGDPNCMAENAFLIDHSISRIEGDVACTAMADNPWTSAGGVTYWAGTTTASTGVGNVKIRSNATYQAGKGGLFGGSWTSAGPDKRYVLNCNETWVVVGKLKVQKYPYTWDFESYNMNRPAEANRTIKKITDRVSAENDTIYGSWTNDHKTNRINYVPACTPANPSINTTSPFYSIDNSGNKTFNIQIHKPLYANGAQLTNGITTIPETEGLGVWVDQAYYAYGDNYRTKRSEQITFDGSKLSVNGTSMSITIPEIKRNEASKPMFVFVKASTAVTATNTKSSTVTFAPYANADGAAVVSVFEVDTDDQTAKDVVITVPSGTSIYKIGVTDQVKDVAWYGYTTESRAINIDHAETKSFSANMSAFYVTRTEGHNVYQIESAGTTNCTAIAEGVYVAPGNGIVLKDDGYVKAEHTKGQKYYIPLFVPACNIATRQADLSGNLLEATTSDTQANKYITGTKVNDPDQYYTMSIQYIKLDDENTKVEGEGVTHEVNVPSFFRYVGSGSTVSNKAYLFFPNVSQAKTLDQFFLDFGDWGDVCDVDGDGFVNIDDVTKVINVICGDEVITVGDVNGDGKIDIDDVTKVINRICGQE